MLHWDADSARTYDSSDVQYPCPVDQQALQGVKEVLVMLETLNASNLFPTLVYMVRARQKIGRGPAVEEAQLD